MALPDASQEESLLFLQLCSQTLLFPALGKDKAELGNSAHTYAFVFFSAGFKASRTVTAKHPQESGCEVGVVLAESCWMDITESSLPFRCRSKNHLQTL